MLDLGYDNSKTHHGVYGTPLGQCDGQRVYVEVLKMRFRGEDETRRRVEAVRAGLI
jgi:hypothetical protein